MWWRHFNLPYLLAVFGGHMAAARRLWEISGDKRTPAKPSAVAPFYSPDAGLRPTTAPDTSISEDYYRHTDHRSVSLANYMTAE